MSEPVYDAECRDCGEEFDSGAYDYCPNCGGNDVIAFFEEDDNPILNGPTPEAREERKPE